MTANNIVFLILLIIPFELIGQTIKFDYDLNGNRISRILIPIQLKSGNIEFPIQEPDKLAIAENKEYEIKGEIKIKIYPNPTKGILKIEIFNLLNDSKTDLRLFDLSGHVLLNKTDLSPQYDLDISMHKNGVYILRILIENTIYNWKIIKNSN
jgi:hypothetical protein